MVKMRLLVVTVVGAAALATATGAARAQEIPSPAATATPAADHGSLMDRAYDGRLHVTLAPYLWLPSVKANTQYTVPTLPRHMGGTIQSDVQVGPSDYLSKVNSGALFSFEARQGDATIFGDYLYMNVSADATVVTSISGMRGRVSIPVTFASSARLTESMWELAAGFAVAHGHNADLNIFAGWRQFPIDTTLAYNATIGTKGLIAPSGTFVKKLEAPDVIFGLRGKAFFGVSRFFVPYYIDLGVGPNNQTWQGYSGAGYVFNHGQTLQIAWRSLNYNGLPATSPIQKLTMGGPLVAYTFGP